MSTSATSHVPIPTSQYFPLPTSSIPNGYFIDLCIDSLALLPTLPTPRSLIFTTTPLRSRRQISSPSWGPERTETQSQKENTTTWSRHRPTPILRCLARSRVAMLIMMPTLITCPITSTKGHRTTLAMRKRTTFEWPRTTYQTTRSALFLLLQASVQYTRLTRQPALS